MAPGRARTEPGCTVGRRRGARPGGSVHPHTCPDPDPHCSQAPDRSHQAQTWSVRLSTPRRGGSAPSGLLGSLEESPGRARNTRSRWDENRTACPPSTSPFPLSFHFKTKPNKPCHHSHSCPGARKRACPDRPGRQEQKQGKPRKNGNKGFTDRCPRPTEPQQPPGGRQVPWPGGPGQRPRLHPARGAAPVLI